MGIDRCPLARIITLMKTAEYPTLVEQEQYWEEWQETRSITPWALRRAETLLALLRSLNLSVPTILDLGCGTGWFTEKLAHFGAATGIDLSAKAIGLAKRRFPDTSFIAGNIFETALPLESFDVVVSQQVIAHVVDQTRYLDLAASALKPGGHLIVTTPNKFVMDRLDWPPEPSSHIERWLSAEDLRRLLQPHFQVLRTTTIIPIGNRGILRLTNSHKLNRLLGLFASERYLESLKESAGLGYTIIGLARKRS